MYEIVITYQWMVIARLVEWTRVSKMSSVLHQVLYAVMHYVPISMSIDFDLHLVVNIITLVSGNHRAVYRAQCR